MKKIILLLAISFGLQAQTLIKLNQIVPFQTNYNRFYLKDWDAQISKIQHGTASSTASAIWIGDSWTSQGLFSQAVAINLRQRFGDAGVGYYGAGSGNSAMISGVADIYNASITRVGTWTNVSQTSYPMSAAIAVDSSSVVNDSIYFVGTATNFNIHYMMKASGGSFVVRVDGTSPTTITTSGTTSWSVTSKTGLTDGTHTLSIKVSTAGSGVLIAGCEINRNQNGIRFHNLGTSGSKAYEWTLQNATNWQNAITQLAPNMAIITLGVNDLSSNFTPAAYVSYITTIVNRVLTAMPNCAIVLFSPADVSLGGTYTMGQYISVLKNYALANNYAFIDNYSLLGDYATANARGLYANTSHINAKGGQVLVDNFVNFLMNGQNMYYTNQRNTVFGEKSLVNNNSLGILNTAIGDSCLTQNKTGTDGTAVGSAALTTNTAISNSAFGSHALTANTSGANGCAFGHRALQKNTTGNYNSGFGYGALYSNLIGQRNAAFGFQALYQVTGSYNTAFGSSAMFTSQASSNGTGIGYSALYSQNGGQENTAVGYLSAFNQVSGSFNNYFGSNAGRYWTGSNKLFIDNQDRTNIAGDTTLAVIYGKMATTAANQYIKINGNLTSRHIIGGTSAPTGTVGGGAGAGGTFTLTSNSADLAGSVSLTTGALPNADDAIINFTFNSAYGVAPTIILIPANKLTANLAKGQDVFATTTTTGFTITSNGTALASTSLYKWNYLIVQ